MNKLLSLVGAAAIVSSFSAISAPTDGNLNFTFQGVIPPVAVTPGSWKFVDLTGNDYSPSTIAFSTTRNTDGSYTLSMVSPEVFAIQTLAPSGSSTVPNFTESSTIKASIASTIINGSALNSAAAADSATSEVTINGVTLSSTPANVVTSATGNKATLSMSATVRLSKESVKASGGNISMTSAVIFSADVA